MNNRKRLFRILAIVIAALILLIIIMLLVLLFRKLSGLKSGKDDNDAAVSETVIDSDYVLDLNDGPVVVANTDDAVEEPAEEMPEDLTEEVTEEPKEVSAIVTVTGDNVRMRAEPNTDCDIVKTCKKGETYDFVEVVGDWTGVDNDGKECYIKTEFLEKAEKEPEQNAGEAASEGTEESGNKDQADGDAPKELPSDGMVEVKCKDGTDMFTKAEYSYFVATWSYTGMADEMMTHHTAEELHKLYKDTH